jgi:tetratricopeptide (TPR) repeat protein
MRKNDFLLTFLLSGFLIPHTWAKKPEIDSVPVFRKMLEENPQPEQKLRLYSKLCAAYWMRNPDSSLYFGNQGKFLFDKGVSKKRIGRHLFTFGMAWENQGVADSAMFYLVKASETCALAGDSLYKYRAVEQIGSLYRIMGQYDTAVTLMKQSLEYFRKNGNNYQIMSALFNIGSLYLEQNHYNKALEYYSQSLAYDSLLNDPMARATHNMVIAETYLDLGTLYRKINPEKSLHSFDLAVTHLKKSIPDFLEARNNTGHCFSLMNLISVYTAKADYSRADSVYKACSECLKINDPRVGSGLDMALAVLLYGKGDKRKAFSVLEKVLADSGRITVLPQYNNSRLLFARLLWDFGNRDRAFKLAGEINHWAVKHSVFPLVQESAGSLAAWYKAMGKPDQEYHFLTIASDYKDSVYQVISRETVDQFEIELSKNLLKSEVERLSASEKYNKTVLFFSILSGSVLILLLIILTLFLLNRHKRLEVKKRLAEEKAKLAEEEKLLQEAELKNVVLEQKLKEEEIDRLNLEMQVKEQELIFQSLMNADLSQKNSSIIEKLSEFKYRFTTKKDQENYANTISEIARNSKADPMERFDILFRQMHGGFLEKLLEICPDLSNSELQVCALLRLNLSSKDIARLVNLNPSSIDGTRHKIRRKLKIDPEMSLTSYLLSVK